jgi:hypothetical protein
VAPHYTGLWAALLGATSPFFLWYGQEARPYALWALLTVLSTWLLLAAVEALQTPAAGKRRTRLLWVGYAVALLMMVTTHFYAFFLLPVHAAYVLAALWQRNPRRAALIALLLLAAGGLTAGAALWIVQSQGGGGNFPDISLSILVPDLVNAFSLGLSVDISQVRWLHWFFIVPALLGAGWMVRSRDALRNGGWVTPAWLLVPALAVLAGNLIMPLYMNSRHLSLMAPAWLLLVAAGLALLGSLRRWMPIVLAVVILGAFTYSTVNYHTREEYAKDDYTSLANYLGPRIVPGDLVLYYPPSSWRIFDYYLPSERIYAAIANGAPLAVHGVPLLEGDTAAWLEEATRAARRTWVVKSGTHPYFDLEGNVERWLRDNLVQVRDAEFFSHSSLRAQLYLPGAPVDESAAPTLPNPVEVTFGDNISLVGIDPGWSSAPEAEGGTWGLSLPVTLYWRVAQVPEQRISYRLQLEELAPDGTVRVLGEAERETWEGSIPTLWWDPGKVIYEVVELPWTPEAIGAQGDGALRVSLFLYETETLAPLDVTNAGGLEVDEEGRTVYLPLQGPHQGPHQGPQQGLQQGLQP